MSRRPGSKFKAAQETSIRQSSIRRTNAFSDYKRRTGYWPALSMALYIGRYALMLAGVAFLLWYSKSHTEEAGKTTIYFVLCTLPIALAWTVAETIAWNRDLRRGGLINKGTVLGVRQLPPE